MESLLAMSLNILQHSPSWIYSAVNKSVFVWMASEVYYMYVLYYCVYVHTNLLKISCDKNVRSSFSWTPNQKMIRNMLVDSFMSMHWQWSYVGNPSEVNIYQVMCNENLTWYKLRPWVQLIRGHRGHAPHFSDSGDIICHVHPKFFHFRFCIWTSFKNKSDVCHVWCEELFMLGVTYSQADVETEFGVLSLILIFLQILASIKWF